jgi:lipid-binding SYLF domain-containing protein
VSVSASLTQDEAARLAEAAKVVQATRASIPQEDWDRARCVAVIPDLKKAAFIVGGEYGKGVMSCRAGERWTAPVFEQLAKGSWGFQAGAEQVDLVLLVMNESGVQKLLENKVTLGGDASVAAGPVGRHGQIATDAVMKAEIVSYSRAQGLFAGVDVSGGVLRPDEDANRRAYGADANPRSILAMRELSAPRQAEAFLAALGRDTSPSTPATRPAPDRHASAEAASTPRASAPPEEPASTTADADIRARIAAIQQTIDRLLSDAAQTPVGTSGAEGTEADGRITVNRARLVQLRQQLDALLAAIERRR